MERWFGRRMSRGVTGTAVAAAAMAALTASQAPGAVGEAAASVGQSAAPPGPTISGDTAYHTELPPLMADEPASSAEQPSPGSVVTGGGELPETVLAAYRRAEAALAGSDPGCHLPWELLAAIGQVESAHARGGRVDASGTTTAPILGPQLNGNGFAAIPDTDGGAYDGDRSYDRAVGPMQFIPSTWAVWGADGNGDGTRDPGNIYDAALAAGRYLCAGGRDLSDPYDLDRAILGYNHSEEYLLTVRTWFAYFRNGHTTVPDVPATAALPEPEPTTASKPERRPSARRGEPVGQSPAKSSPSPESSPTGGRPQPDEQSDGVRLDLPDAELPDVDEDLVTRPRRDRQPDPAAPSPTEPASAAVEVSQP
ncbi:lytic transglycosylase domain-containing protein [Streptomyces sp. 8N706]|uniref:lytic transglycosylase domain-containing protein n=1 Tax=Streptomyces sp. 8N706 TaxID=3457416 RepID=UPI003FD620B9